MTLRHLKKNKRRTLVTVIGVIISVAMITSVATLSISFLDLMKRQTMATDGNWHVSYKNVNKNQLKTIKKDKETKALIISKNIANGTIEGTNNKNTPSLFIKAYNAEGFKHFPFQLTKGRLPQTKNEIVLPDEMKGKYRIGDQIKVGTKQRDSSGKEKAETFTVTGFMKQQTWEFGQTGPAAFSYVNQNMLDQKDRVDAFVILNHVNNALFDHAETLAKENHIDKVITHNSLLRYYGVTRGDFLRTTLNALAAIIMSVIVISSISLIYNAFAISVSERLKYLGMLASAGATKKQKRASVFFEGAIIGAISIPVGIIAGISGIGATFWFINPYIEEALDVTEKLKVVVTPMSIIMACGISIITIFISTYLPARKASKVSAIDAIRQTHDVKLSGRTVKTSKLSRKLFGMEAEIGLKNLKRNKRRYRATLFSLIISIVLVLSVSFFTTSLKKSLELAGKDINYDIQVSSPGGNTDKLKPLAKLNHVTKYSLVQQLTLESWVDKGMVPENFLEDTTTNENVFKNGKFAYDINLYGLDEKDFKNYAKRIGADLKELQNPADPAAIVIDKASYQDPKTGKYIETKSINKALGQSIDLFFSHNDAEKQTFLGKVKIGALTDQVPMGISKSRFGELNIIVSQKTMHALLNKQMEKAAQANLYLNTSNPMETQKAIEKVKQADMTVENVHQKGQKIHQQYMLMSVFSYGFLTLITLIAIANILNTISTSLSLRKREFAMLKSVGMTESGLYKMINYESIFYGIKALLYGLPASIAVMCLIYWSNQFTFEYGFTFPWMSLISVVIAIFIIIISAMLYSMRKIKKENIIEALKQENI
nr:FtsX-like permease family protein [Scopulibacillus daqui]